MPFDHREEHVDDRMLILQANIDDMNPEYCSYVTDLLLEQGANDVYWIPIIMKKGRPGVMLNVLTDDAGAKRMEDVIFRETTTLGLRYLRASCHRLGRELHRVDTPWGSIQVKAGFHQGELVQFAPEFKECEQAAKTHGVPLKQVYDEVRRRFMERGRA
ncbi:nickel insertion protein [Paenibacillus oleatilyticus]|uniref:nickel insertion protein n=1 Tax=Paenibacillus oleatilyticus TaxID=2594886 RepID=UPI001C1F2D88|nr:nickel insertion protein [Paenibacillus oleatilyticus]MBU7314630.1 LarC family nickel insertion protein [Paenibacillus oleatilyticus]